MKARFPILFLVLVTALLGLNDAFRDPPRAYAPSAFWWWFTGAAYEKGDVEAAIDAMHQAGLGGFRITPVYTFPGAPSGGPGYLSEDYRELVAHAIRHGLARGMAPESLLGSGWPFGGPYIPQDKGAMQIRHVLRTADGPGILDGTLPFHLAPGENLLALQLARPDGDGGVDLSTVIDWDSLTNREIPPGRWLLIAYVTGPTGMKVKRAAPGAEGLVLDHFRRDALDLHLRHNGDVQAPSLDGLRAVSMDSWEVFGANWTPALPAEFERRRGYALRPYLAALFLPSGEDGARIRYDFRRTISELALENFFTPLRDWAHRRGFQTRVEAHGTPADIIEAYGLNDAPEAEAYGPQDHFAICVRDRQLASSAAHLFDRNMVSSETFTWLRYPMFRETLAQMKAAADASYLDGVNQINFHGVPFSPRSTAAPGYYFSASSFVSPGNTWWPYLPQLTSYLRRCNFMLQQGQPSTDVAVYLPIEDIWREAYGSWYDLAGAIEEHFRRNVTLDLLESLAAYGYTFDLINGTRLNSGAASRYRAIVPDVESIEPKHLSSLLAFRNAGGLVLAVGQPHVKAPGFENFKNRDGEVRAMGAELFRPADKNVLPRHSTSRLDPRNHPAAMRLREVLQPDMPAPGLGTGLGFAHRRTADEEIYFVANLQDRPLSFTASFRVSGRFPRLFRPETGNVEPLFAYNECEGRIDLALVLKARESAFVVFGPQTTSRCESHNVDRILSIAGDHATAEVSANGCYFLHSEGKRFSAQVDDFPGSLVLGGAWQLLVPGHGARELDMPVLWTDLPAFTSFSGTASYTTGFALPTCWLRPDQRVLLECANVREIVEVVVNGKSAGIAWKPPFTVDITAFVHAQNTVELRVTNLLFNRMLHAGPLPAPYVPLSIGNPKPIPSGLSGAVRLRPVRTIRLVQ
ncbi:MAG: hypothetical protein LC130_26210 [Bryobacterales bacterium]|nr:hypothetical protein [Bryobacterales bacterium]